MLISKDYIEEPILKFKNGTDINPVFGLYKYGPFDLQPDYRILTGIIGSVESIQETKDFLNRLHQPIPSNDDNHLPFPGLVPEIKNLSQKMFNSKLNFDFSLDKDWIREFDTGWLDELEKRDDRIERVRNSLNLIHSEMNAIKELDVKPKVIIIAIPKDMFRLCQKSRLRTTRIKIYSRKFEEDIFPPAKEYDFHNIIKCYGLEVPAIPTQIMFPESLKESPFQTQQPSETAWNFCVAMLYKSSAQPWKFWDFPPYTVFIGISFYRDFEDTKEGMKNILRSSVSHIFMSSGENYIVKGKPFNQDQDAHDYDPHLSEPDAILLMQDILRKCIAVWKDKLARVVIHKTSLFETAESQGFRAAFNEFHVKHWDFVTVRSTPLRWIRQGGIYPTLRGTYINLGGDDHFLTTTGYIPSLATYPGPRIPAPLHIKLYPKNVSVSPKEIFKEILALTKLDWNDTQFSVHFPVTIGLAQKVKNIFVEGAIENIAEPQTEYRYFM